VIAVLARSLGLVGDAVEAVAARELVAEFALDRVRERPLALEMLR
jgi:hypothetical protein